MANTTEVIIIGGGAVGVCSAYYLWKQGKKVILLEKGEIASGCSYGNAGLVVPSHVHPFAAPGVISQGVKWLLNPKSPFSIKPRLEKDLLSWLWKFKASCTPQNMHHAMPILLNLNLSSLALYRELSKENWLDLDLQEKGLFMLYKTEKGKAENLEEAEEALARGLKVQILENSVLREMEPSLKGYTGEAVHYMEDAHLHPANFVRSMANFLEKQDGIEIHRSTEVTDFVSQGESLSEVITSRGNFKAEEFVFAGGSWTPQLTRKLKLSLPVQAAKGYSITLQRKDLQLTTPMILTEAKVAVTPLKNQLRIAGRLELSGIDLSVSKTKVRSVINALNQYIPGFTEAKVSDDEFQKSDTWSGLRPSSPDGLPFIGRTKVRNNLTIATGHGMLGISMAPITGKLVSEIIQRTPPAISLEALQPERFS